MSKSLCLFAALPPLLLVPPLRLQAQTVVQMDLAGPSTGAEGSGHYGIDTGGAFSFSVSFDNPPATGETASLMPVSFLPPVDFPADGLPHLSPSAGMEAGRPGPFPGLPDQPASLFMPPAGGGHRGEDDSSRWIPPLPAPEVSGGWRFDSSPRFDPPETSPKADEWILFAPGGPPLHAGINGLTGGGGEDLTRLNSVALPFPLYLAALVSLGAAVGALCVGGAREETYAGASEY